MSGNIQVEQTALPGIGVRHDLVTSSGHRIGVISYRDGRRDLLVYDVRDPDACATVVPLTDESADALAEILGAPRLVQRLASLAEQAEALITEQVAVPATSRYAGRPLGETRARTRTGASVVAVMRQGAIVPSPGPDFRLEALDHLVVVGTREGVAGVATILSSG